MDLSQHLEKPGRESRAFFGSLCNRRRLGCLRHRLNGSQWLGRRAKAGVSSRCSSLAIVSGFAITLALTSLPPLIVKTTSRSEAFGLITISPVLAASTVTTGVATTLKLTTLPPLMVKTTSRSEAFGLITISPALAASTVTTGVATTLKLTTLPPLMVKTTSRSEAFGLITISPALAAPTVTSSAATTAANNFISGHSVGFKGRAQGARKHDGNNYIWVIASTSWPVTH